MHSRIREVRRAKGLTLADVGARCTPPTTAQTIGRLETGMRTISVDWLNRIAGALLVDPSDLVAMTDRPDVPVAAILSARGAEAPRHPMVLTAPAAQTNLVGMVVEDSNGDYRAGDHVWLAQLAGPDFTDALNRDCLLPLPAGAFVFGRVIVATADGDVTILPIGRAERPLSGLKPGWVAMAQTMIRKL